MNELQKVNDPLTKLAVELESYYRKRKLVNGLLTN